MNCNFNIEDRYLQAVQKFQFAAVPEDAADLPIHASHLDTIVDEVSQKIIAASNLRPIIFRLGKRDLSLREVCYIIVQDSDKGTGITAERIESATDQDKVILSHVIKRLSQDFVQVTSEDLNTLALLFGIQRVQEVSFGVIVAECASRIETIEKSLNQLKQIRGKYPAVFSEETPECIKAFVADVDTKILRHTEYLAELQESIA